MRLLSSLTRTSVRNPYDLVAVCEELTTGIDRVDEHIAGLRRLLDAAQRKYPRLDDVDLLHQLESGKLAERSRSTNFALISIEARRSGNLFLAYKAALHAVVYDTRAREKLRQALTRQAAIHAAKQPRPGRQALSDKLVLDVVAEIGEIARHRQLGKVIEVLVSRGITPPDRSTLSRQLERLGVREKRSVSAGGTKKMER